MKINEKLIYYRNQNNLSQAALAKKMYVSRQTISNWETGKTYPDIQSLVLMADIYQTTVDQLVKDDIDLMQNNLSKFKLRELSVGLITTLVATYISFISIHWLPLPIASMLVATFSTLGIIIAMTLIKLNNKLHLQTFKQTIAFLNGKTVEEINYSVKKRRYILTIAAIVGILLGTILTYLIAINIIGWSL